MTKLYDQGIFRVFRNIKTMKFFLLPLFVFGTLGQFSFPLVLDEMSWDSVSGSSVLNSQYLDDTIQQKYVSSEDEATDGSASKRPSDPFSAQIPGHSTLPIVNLNFETYLDSINSFHYILTCGFPSLRSPPLFS
jgi:hypothetical protein